jgi:lipopolysaccharide biosynthesis protein
MFRHLNRLRKKLKYRLKDSIYWSLQTINKLVAKSFGRDLPQNQRSDTYYNFYKSFNEKTHGSFGCNVPQENLSRASDSKLRVVAFYLPQFHEIPENDQAWGKGFTEWTNVSKSIPQYVGHYQPRLPGELGFYNLTNPQVLQRQVDMATSAGVHAFCFHYYWFSGKRLLEKPLDIFMRLNLGDFKFCINWANENWTKRWDGLDDEVIIKQENLPGEAELFFNDILPVLRHPNYIQIEPGVPLLLIYKPESIPNAKDFAEILRTKAKQNGFRGLKIIMCQTFGMKDPQRYQFDGACEFPPHGNTLKKKEDLVFLNKQFNGRVYDASNIVTQLKSSFVKTKPSYPLFRCAFPGWDNSARKPGLGHIMHGMSPSVFQDWLFLISNNTYKDSEGRPWIFINAWNEWGEGAYLEPDRELGFKNLNAVSRVVDSYGLDIRRKLVAARESRLEKTEADLAILLHIFHEDLIDELLEKIASVEFTFDFYITVTDTLTTQAIRKIIAKFPAVKILELNNHGRDILPFLKAVRHFELGRYKAVCKLHSKKSTHRQDGDGWRKAMFSDLLNPEDGKQVIQKFTDSTSSGLLAPQFSIVKAGGESLFANEEYLKYLFSTYKIKPVWEFPFPAGTMFWASGRLLNKINETHIPPEMFETEDGQLDATLAHAYERFFGAICTRMNWSITGIKNIENSFSL